MAWEDGLNEITQIAAQDEARFAAQTAPEQYQEGYYRGVAATTTAPIDYPAPTNYDRGAIAVSIPTPTGRIYRCSRDQHYFDCKHEIRCQCGLTERLPLQVQEGL